MTEPSKQSDKHHTIAGPLVSWIEQSGGRVVPIYYNAPFDQIEAEFKKLNGVVFPGTCIYVTYIPHTCAINTFYYHTLQYNTIHAY